MLGWQYLNSEHLTPKSDASCKIHTCTRVRAHTLSHWPSMQSCPCLALGKEVFGALATFLDFHFPVYSEPSQASQVLGSIHIQNSNFNDLEGNKSQFYVVSIYLSLC